MPVSAEEVRRSFNEKLKTLTCPHCGTEYTDFAVEWHEAYLEGRRDALNDLGTTERDGPIKLKCELCSGRALTDVFLSAPAPIGAESSAATQFAAAADCASESARRPS